MSNAFNFTVSRFRSITNDTGKDLDFKDTGKKGLILRVTPTGKKIFRLNPGFAVCGNTHRRKALLAVDLRVMLKIGVCLQHCRPFFYRFYAENPWWQGDWELFQEVSAVFLGMINLKKTVLRISEFGSLKLRKTVADPGPRGPASEFRHSLQQQGQNTDLDLLPLPSFPLIVWAGAGNCPAFFVV